MATDALPHFKRPHHQRIAKLLQAFNADLLLKAECYFGGGTAIALALNEYRESVGIDFLCSSQQGFRTLRDCINSDLGPLLRFSVKMARDIICNQNKILTFLEVEEGKIKIEIIREGNTNLTGAMDPILGVPVLSRTDLWAQKLMANADRALDKSTSSRDIIDLAMMLKNWGGIPTQAWEKSVAAYGKSIASGFNNAMGMVSDTSYLKKSMARMDMDLNYAKDILNVLDDASAALPLSDSDEIEKCNRVSGINNPEHPSAANSLFHEIATQAAREAGAINNLNWAKVERDFVSQAMAIHGINSEEIIQTIASISPAAVSNERMKAVSRRIRHQAEKLSLLQTETLRLNVEQENPSP